MLTLGLFGGSRSAADAPDGRGPIPVPGMRVTVAPGAVQAPDYRFADDCRKPDPFRARWIWLNSPTGTPAPVMVRFRKTVTLDSDPKHVRAYISADVIYRLFVNGHLVARGPADMGRDYDREPRAPRWLYDYRDLTPFFHAGKNVIAAEVFTTGFVSSRVSRGHGLLFEARIAQTGRPDTIVATDALWRATPDSSWKTANKYDAGAETIGWRGVGFDDTTWPTAAVVPSVWTPLAASEIPPLMEALYPPEFPDSGQRPLLLDRDGEAELRFDRVLAAYPTFKITSAAAGAELRIIPGERQGQTSRVITITLRAGEQTFEYPFLDSFSLLHIAATRVTAPVTIEAGAVFSSQPVAWHGSFACSDPALNRLWTTSAYLTQICMQTHHLDSPNHQEPICDPGDYLIESVANYYAFGTPWLARQDLRKFGLLLRDLHYRNFHTSYALLWLQMLMRYYDFTGDRTVVAERAPEVNDLLDTFTSYRGSNGLISEAPNYMFMDWVTIEGFACHHPPAVIGQGYMTAFYYRALADATRVAEITGDVGRVAAYTALRRETAVAFERELWNATAGLYRDGKPFVSHVAPGTWLPADRAIETFSPHVNALAVLYGLCPTERCPSVLDRVMSTASPNCQPYFMYFLFDALAQSGRFERYAIDQMHRWRIFADTQTYREMWDSGDSSHAWGAGPLIALSSNVLGVRPAAPGFTRIAIRPLTCSLVWARGSVPTPHGPINVAWERTGGKFHLTITIPPGTSADVTLPTAGAATVHAGPGKHEYATAINGT